MKYILSLIISGALVVSGFGQTRNVLVGTNNTVIQPTNFWSADASNARTGLGLGTAATNPASAFQPTSSALTNLASGNGGALTNLQATNIVGLIPSSNIPSVTFTNLSGTLSIAQGGTGATNAANARQNLGSTTVGDAVFTATNAAAARTAIGALTSNSDGSGLTNLTAANITGTVALASNLSSPLALTNGGTGATNAETARTNLGLGWSALTNTDATNFRNAIGLGTTNNVVFGSIASGSDTGINGSYIEFGGADVINTEELRLIGNWQVEGSFGFNGTNVPLFQAQSRTNFGLPWSGLTNTNAATFQAALFGSNTNPVLVNTNGEVVSPTNFWQAAPIATALQNSQPVTNATNAATNARLLFLFSLAPSTTGVTNTITLPTNGSTFNGDVATITHNAPTSSVTAIRQLGASTNLITLSQPDETVRFLYRNNQWELMDNISYIEPIYFSGTNAAANAAASRTNLGLGNIFTNTYQTTNTAVFINTNLVVTNSAASFVNIGSDYIESPHFQVADGTNGIVFETPAVRDITLTNLGFGLGGTNQFGASLIKAKGTNGLVISDDVNDQAIITFPTDSDPVVLNATYWNHAAVRTSLGLGATNNVSFSNVTASGTLTATGTVTATTNLVVNGYVDFSTNHTNSNPATNNQIQKFLQIRIGTNAYFLPLYQ